MSKELIEYIRSDLAEHKRDTKDSLEAIQKDLRVMLEFRWKLAGGLTTVTVILTVLFQMVNMLIKGG